MIESDWKSLREAIELLQASPGLTKLEGLFFIVYKVGLLIRVDIKSAI